MKRYLMLLVFGTARVLTREKFGMFLPNHEANDLRLFVKMLLAPEDT